MNICVLTSQDLKDFPPILTMLKVLSELGHEVTFLSLTKENLTKDINGVNNLYVKETPLSLSKIYAKNRILASICFRIEKWLKRKYIASLLKLYRNEIFAADIVWVVHEDTFVLGGRSFLRQLPPFYYTMYELQYGGKHSSPMHEYSAKHAKALIVPEYCRAHIIKSIYELKKLPYIIPNKPYCHPQNRNLPISSEEIRKKIQKIENSHKKIIMYMGILSNERPLEPMIKVCQKLHEEYEFTVLGPQNAYLDYLLNKYPDQFTYLGCVPPPNHLEVASHADFAYICYFPQNQSINAVFCAPNKVYEFAGFGIPMICNDVPGLKYTVENACMGECITDFTIENLIQTIKREEKNYDILSQNAKNYYTSENLNDMFENIISIEENINK